MTRLHHLPFILAILPPLLLILTWGETATLLSDPVVLSALLASSIAMTITERSRGSLFPELRRSYTFFFGALGWQIAGIGGAMLVLLVGTALEALRWPLRWPSRSFLRSCAQLIGSNGLGLLVAVILHDVLVVERPPFEVFDVTHVVVHVGVLIVGYSVFVAMSWLATDTIRYQISTNRLLIDMMLILFSTVGAPTLYGLGVFPYVMLCSLIAMQAVFVYQNVSSRDVVEQRVRELSLLQRLSQSISASLEPETVLDTIYQEIRGLVPATTFFVALYDDVSDTLSYPYVNHDGQQREWQTRKLGTGLTDTVIRQKQPLTYSAAMQETPSMSNLDTAEIELASFAGVPLLVEKKIIGVMGILHRDDPHAMTPEVIRIMQTVAGQASLSVRNATLYKRTLWFADHLSQINESMQQVLFSMDHHNALERVINLAKHISGAQQAAVYLLDVNSRLTLAETSHTESDMLDNALRYTPEDFSNGSQINQTDPHDPYVPTIMVPLRSGNTTVGCITLYHAAPHYYSRSEIDLLEMLANQLTAAMDNSELLRALEMYATEQAQLVHLSRAVSSDLDLQDVIHETTRTLSQMLRTPYVVIGLFMPEGDQVRIYTHHNGVTTPTPSDYPCADAPELEQIRSETSISPHLYDTADNDLSKLLREIFNQSETSTAVLVPQLVGDHVTGFIGLQMGPDYHLSDNDRRLIEMATYQISGHIQNARIYAATEDALAQRLGELVLLEDIAQQISQSLEIDSTIDNVLEAALTATAAEHASLGLLSEDRTYLAVIVREWINGELMRHRVIQDTEDGIIGWVMKQGQLRIVPDNSAVPYYLPTNQEVTWHSSLAIPLRQGEEIIGVLNVESSKQNYFHEEQISFIKSLAGHAAISITNARLLDERQHQIHTLTGLRRLTLQAAVTVDRYAVLYAINETALSLFGAYETAIYAFDVPTSEIVLLSGKMLQEGTVVNIHPTIPSPIIYEVAADSQIHVIEETRDHPQYQTGEGQAAQHRSLIAAPIVRRQQVREIICLTFEQPRTFTRRDRDTLELLATQSASHLENAELNTTLQSANDRMRAILNANRDGIILLDRAGRLQDANLAAERMLGLDLQKHMNELFVNILVDHAGIDPGATDDNGAKQPLIEMAQLYRLDPMRLTNREYALNRNGKTLHIHETGTPVSDESGYVTGRLLALRDVTQERQLEEYRTQIQRMVVHDLRGPLAAIVSGLYLVLAIAEDPETKLPDRDMNKALNAAMNSASNLMRLVESLHDIPRLRLKQFKLQQRSIYPAGLAKDAVDSLSGTLQVTDINITIDIDNKPPLFVDDDLIRRVFINLVHNALKFTPAHGDILVTADHETHEGYRRILVCDSGPGIPDNMRERIFEEFAQIENRKPAQGERGSGLGLTFCKLAVEAHGGTIWAEPDGPLPGACIAFTLPVVTQTEPQTP